MPARFDFSTDHRLDSAAASLLTTSFLAVLLLAPVAFGRADAPDPRAASNDKINKVEACPTPAPVGRKAAAKLESAAPSLHPKESPASGSPSNGTTLAEGTTTQDVDEKRDEKKEAVDLGSDDIRTSAGTSEIRSSKAKAEAEVKQCEPGEESKSDLTLPPPSKDGPE